MKINYCVYYGDISTLVFWPKIRSLLLGVEDEANVADNGVDLALEAEIHLLLHIPQNLIPLPLHRFIYCGVPRTGLHNSNVTHSLFHT